MTAGSPAQAGPGAVLGAGLGLRARSTRAGWPGRVREGGTALLLPRIAGNGDAVGGGERSGAQSVTPRRPHANSQSLRKCALLLVSRSGHRLRLSSFLHLSLRHLLHNR